MGVTGKVLLLAEDHERLAIKSFRNIEGVIASNLGQANTYDVIWAETVIMSKGTLDLGQNVPRGTEEHAEQAASRQMPATSQEAAARSSALEAESSQLEAGDSEGGAE